MDGAALMSFMTAVGLIGGEAPGRDAKVIFVVPGQPTEMSPIAAFRQGLTDAQEEQVFKVHGLRCVAYGKLELFADVKASGTDLM